jgi:hypothetical protein
VRGGRDAHVLTIPHLGRKSRELSIFIMAADELRAVVGLPDQIAKGNAEAIQVLLDASGKDGAGGCRAPFGERPE